MNREVCSNSRGDLLPDVMVKEEKKDKLIAHHTKTGAGGDLAALDDTEDLGGAEVGVQGGARHAGDERVIARAATAAGGPMQATTRAA